MYTHLSVYRQNENSSCEVSQEDMNEILQLLNTGVYVKRSRISGESLVTLQTVIEEEGGDFTQVTNCHTLTRKAQALFKWERVFGYAFSREDSGKSGLILRSHSISRNETGELIEATLFFREEQFEFIEHESGQCGIDLAAHCSTAEQADN